MQPFDAFVRHVHADSVVGLHGPSIPQLPQPSSASTDLSTAAMSIEGYPSGADVSMQSDVDDDAVSVGSDGSMLSQWSFGTKHDHSHSPPPHGVYLPPVPSSGVPLAATPTSMPPIPSGYSFLEDLNGPLASDFDVLDTYSSSGSSRRSSLADYTSTYSVVTGTSTFPTQSAAEAVLPATLSHRRVSDSVPGVYHHASASGNLPGSVPYYIPQSTSIVDANSYGNNLMENPPTSFVRGSGPPVSVPAQMPTAVCVQTPSLIPTVPPVPASTVTPAPMPAPIIVPNLPALTLNVPPVPAPTVIPTAPTLPGPTIIPNPPAVAPMSALTPPPTSVLTPAPTTSAPHVPAIQAPVPAVTPSLALNTAVEERLPSKRGQGKRTTQAQSASVTSPAATASIIMPLDIFNLAPRRSGRSVVPSTRNTVANQIGSITPKQVRSRGYNAIYGAQDIFLVSAPPSYIASVEGSSLVPNERVSEVREWFGPTQDDESLNLVYPPTPVVEAAEAPLQGSPTPPSLALSDYESLPEAPVAPHAPSVRSEDSYDPNDYDPPSALLRIQQELAPLFVPERVVDWLVDGLVDRNTKASTEESVARRH
ncbi:hypothetical protein L210DRAFT_3646068 [Boletus edulis BED1]|uniref:Uncharacterized protein n=1 Tax=Boletus edulis BED1 TaxID=1328754 RepID=A0AAD4GDR5_BOLED|nr:hypothetical protein L210DRAFT_3646068 [Boletus edulis BED1]